MRCDKGELLAAIQDAMDPALLIQKYRKDWTPENPTYGFCSLGAEAAWFLLRECGMDDWTAYYAYDEDGGTHWWLESPTEIFDPTAEQYLLEGEDPPYDAPSKKACGFSGSRRRGPDRELMPSTRAMRLIQRVDHPAAESLTERDKAYREHGQRRAVAARGGSGTLRLYHTTPAKNAAQIRAEGLRASASMGYQSPKWYMLADRIEGALLHHGQDNDVVFTFEVPWAGKWEGYPYLWPASTDEERHLGRWFALRQPLPPKFIVDEEVYGFEEARERSEEPMLHKGARYVSLRAAAALMERDEAYREHDRRHAMNRHKPLRYIPLREAGRGRRADDEDRLYDLITRAKRAVWHGTDAQAEAALMELDEFLDSGPAVEEIDGALIILEDLWEVFHGFAPRPRRR